MNFEDFAKERGIDVTEVEKELLREENEASEALDSRNDDVILDPEEKAKRFRELYDKNKREQEEFLRSLDLPVGNIRTRRAIGVFPFTDHFASHESVWKALEHLR